MPEFIFRPGHEEEGSSYLQRSFHEQKTNPVLNMHFLRLVPRFPSASSALHINSELSLHFLRRTFQNKLSEQTGLFQRKLPAPALLRHDSLFGLPS